MLFAALRESAHGAKRTYRSALTHVRFGRRSGRDVIDGGAKTTTLTHFAYRIDMWDANGENIFEHLRLNPRASALSSITGGGSGPPNLGYVRWRGLKEKPRS